MPIPYNDINGNPMSGGTWTFVLSASTSVQPVPIEYDSEISFNNIGTFCYDYTLEDDCETSTNRLCYEITECCDNYSATTIDDKIYCSPSTNLLNLLDGTSGYTVDTINGIDIDENESISLRSLNITLLEDGLIELQHTGETYDFVIPYTLISTYSGCTFNGELNVCYVPSGYTEYQLSVCQDYGVIDLFSQVGIDVNKLSSYSWTVLGDLPESNSFDAINGLIDTIVNEGEYSFNLSGFIDRSPCQVNIDILLDIIALPYSGNDKQITVCDGTVVDLFETISTTGQTMDGVWTILPDCDQPQMGNIDLVNATFDTIGHGIGEYCFKYTVSNDVCGEYNTQLTIFVNNCDDDNTSFGNGNSENN